MDKSEFTDPASIAVIDAYLRWEAYVCTPEEVNASKYDFYPLWERKLDGVHHLMLGVDLDDGFTATLYANINHLPQGPMIETLVITGDCVAEIIVNDAGKEVAEKGK